MELLRTDPLESATAAGLRYVGDDRMCIRRRRHGQSFIYLDRQGRPVRDPRTLARIRSLVIPPAWEDVLICSSPNGHIQAVGRDIKGRKQYRYHPLYRQVRDQAKFSRMIAFGAMLARIRRQVRRDLRRHGLPREKVLAALVTLLEATCIRVGNEEYARDNESFGLTTLRDEHVTFRGGRMRFQFKGKSGQMHSIELHDPRLARIVRSCQEIPGQELFQYINERGRPVRVSSEDVNAYISAITGVDFTAKDFRTWAGTVLAARELAKQGPCTSVTDGKRKIVAAVREVSRKLGNRPATCRNYYIHPAVIDAYSDGTLFQALQRGTMQAEAYGGKGLGPEEYSVFVIIAEAMDQTAKKDTKSSSRLRNAA